MSVPVCNVGHIVSVLQCLSHSLHLTALFLSFFACLVYRVCVCVVSPVKLKVCRQTVPVESAVSILPPCMGDKQGGSFLKLLFCDLRMN